VGGDLGCRDVFRNRGQGSSFTKRGRAERTATGRTSAAGYMRSSGRTKK
jgi:hypothetical protein